MDAGTLQGEARKSGMRPDMSPNPWARLETKDTIDRGLADELLVIAAVIHRAQQLAAALESSAAHQSIRRFHLAELQQAKDEFRAMVDDLVGAMHPE